MFIGLGLPLTFGNGTRQLVRDDALFALFGGPSNAFINYNFLRGFGLHEGQQNPAPIEYFINNTRSFRSTAFNSSGELVNFAGDELRLTDEGLYIGDEYTNDYINSNRFIHSDNSGVTINTESLDIVTAPDGSVVDRITGLTGNFSRSVSLRRASTGEFYTTGCFVKQGNFRYVGITAGTTSGLGAVFDFENKSITTPSGDQSIAGFQEYANGWFFIWHTSNTSVSRSLYGLFPFPATGGNPRLVILSSPASYLYAWGMQSYPGKYKRVPPISTTDLSVTVPHDSIKISNNTISTPFSFTGKTSFTCIVEFKILDLDRTGRQFLFFLNSPIGRIDFYMEGTNIVLVKRLSGFGAVFVGFSWIRSTDVQRICFTYDFTLGRFTYALNSEISGTRSISNPVAVGGINSLVLDSLFNNQGLNGYLRRLLFVEGSSTLTQVRSYSDTSFALPETLVLPTSI